MTEPDTLPPDADSGPWGHELHWHPVGQLLYAASGRATISVADTGFPLDVGHAVWLPPAVPHSAVFEPGFVALGFAAVTGTAAVWPLEASGFVVDERMRARLIASHWESEFVDETLFAELADVDRERRLPALHGPLTGVIDRAIRLDPTDRRTLEDWAAELHVGQVTIRRAFRAEAGMPFTEWRTRVRLELALPMLERGEPVGRIARRVGFSDNGFTIAFRRRFGCAPSQHRLAS